MKLTQYYNNCAVITQLGFGGAHSLIRKTGPFYGCVGGWKLPTCKIVAQNFARRDQHVTQYTGSSHIQLYITVGNTILSCHSTLLRVHILRWWWLKLPSYSLKKWQENLFATFCPLGFFRQNYRETVLSSFAWRSPKGKTSQTSLLSFLREREGNFNHHQRNTILLKYIPVGNSTWQ